MSLGCPAQKDPKEWLVVVVVAVCVTFCSYTCNPGAWEWLPRWYFHDKFFCLLPAELEELILLCA